MLRAHGELQARGLRMRMPQQVHATAGTCKNATRPGLDRLPLLHSPPWPAPLQPRLRLSQQPHQLGQAALLPQHQQRRRVAPHQAAARGGGGTNNRENAVFGQGRSRELLAPCTCRSLPFTHPPSHR